MEKAAEEARNDPAVQVATPSEPALPSVAEAPKESFWQMLPKAKLAIYLVFMTIFYLLPIVFPSQLVGSREVDHYVFTTVSPTELLPLSYFVTSNIEFSGVVHAIFGFRTFYLLGIWFSSHLVTTVLDIYKHVQKK